MMASGSLGGAVQSQVDHEPLEQLFPGGRCCQTPDFTFDLLPDACCSRGVIPERLSDKVFALSGKGGLRARLQPSPASLVATQKARL